MFFCWSISMSAKKYTTKQVTERVLDSDFDPGIDSQESQDEADTSTHESQDEADTSADTNILDRQMDTDYVDRVIKKDGTVRVKACQRVHGERESDSLFDHSSEFEKDEASVTPPSTLQELRGKKRTHSVSLPAHASATSSAQGPVAGPSLVRTSTPNGPGAVTAAFGSGSKSNASLDDTIHGYVDLGDVSDSDVIFMGDQPVPQDATSGDDSDTMDAEDLNQCMRSQTQDAAGADADDEDNAPDAQDQGRQRFLYSKSFSDVDTDEEGQEGDAECDGEDHADNNGNNNANPPPPGLPA